MSNRIDVRQAIAALLRRLGLEGKKSPWPSQERQRRLSGRVLLRLETLEDRTLLSFYPATNFAAGSVQSDQAFLASLIPSALDVHRARLLFQSGREFFLNG